jgi:hypothetical protein
MQEVFLLLSSIGTGYYDLDIACVREDGEFVLWEGIGTTSLTAVVPTGSMGAS